MNPLLYRLLALFFIHVHKHFGVALPRSIKLTSKLDFCWDERGQQPPNQSKYLSKWAIQHPVLELTGQCHHHTQRMSLGYTCRPTYIVILFDYRAESDSNYDLIIDNQTENLITGQNMNLMLAWLLINDYQAEYEFYLRNWSPGRIRIRLLITGQKFWPVINNQLKIEVSKYNSGYGFGTEVKVFWSVTGIGSIIIKGKPNQRAFCDENGTK